MCRAYGPFAQIKCHTLHFYDAINKQALKEANIHYKSQYTVFDSTIDKWNAKYILDFLVYGEYCKIAVECDGNTYHSSQLAKENDLKRDVWVKKIGFDDTLRFNTEQINYNLNGVIKQIKEVIAAYDKIRYDKLKKNVFIVEDIFQKCHPKNMLIIF